MSNPVNNLNAAVTLLLETLATAQRISGLIAAANSEGRDLTAVELAQLRAEDDQARAGLVAAIEAAKGG